MLSPDGLDHLTHLGLRLIHVDVLLCVLGVRAVWLRRACRWLKRASRLLLFARSGLATMFLCDRFLLRWLFRAFLLASYGVSTWAIHAPAGVWIQLEQLVERRLLL